MRAEIAPHDAAGSHPGWTQARRALTAGFLALVLWLIVDQARRIDGAAVLQALHGYRVHTLLGAALLVACSHAVFASYDLISQHLTGHALPSRQVLAVAFVSYAFNLNFGALVGGVAMRYRLYARLGLQPRVVTRVLGYSLITNWLGYAALAGLVFVWWPLSLPDIWPLGENGLRLLGALLLLFTAAYLGACFKSRRRSWQWHRQVLALPSGRIGLLQLAVSSAHWLLMASTVGWLLGAQIGFSTVLAVMLIAAVAAVLAHVPAGLGVLEGVFLLLLSPPLGQGELLAALLAYRALYYLLPLAVALPLYFLLGRRRSIASGARHTPETPAAP